MLAALWAACVVAADGLLSLALDVEAVPARGIGPFVVPAATIVAMVVLALVLLRGVPRDRAWPVPVAAVVGVYLALLITGAVVRMLEAEAAAALVYAAAASTNLFTLVPVGLAAIAALAFVLIARATSAGAHRPRWPWERDDGGE
jgi:chromate transport protein ChrA